MFVLFRREFDLAEVPVSADFTIWASSRYRLTINGQFVSAGPGRFVSPHAEYDILDLSPWLVKGNNRIEVLVNFYNASSYQTMPDDQPGFRASGDVCGITLGTPGEWSAYLCSAWDPDASCYTFAQGPLENCDTRLLGTERKIPLLELAHEAAPWMFSPFSGTPIPVQTFHVPAKLVRATALANDRRLLGFMARALHSGTGEKVKFRTWIRSPMEQTVHLDCFWCDLTLNGKTLDVVKAEGDKRSLAHAEMDLIAGDQLLEGEMEIFSDRWACLFGVARQAALEFRAAPEGSTATPFAILEPGRPWRTVADDLSRITPARMVAWDEPAQRPESGACLPGQPTALEASSGAWCFEFDHEFLGFPCLEVEAPSGSILDITCTDWLDSEHLAAPYIANPFSHVTDRFILAGGKQRVELYHPRGGSYLQATLRAPDPQRAETLCVHSVMVRSRQALPQDASQFACGNENLEWTWKAAIRTLRASTEDAFSDSPARERSSYIGDALVNFHIQTLFTADLRVPRRVIRQFAQAQLPDGQLPCCVPSCYRKAHRDFTLHWIRLLRDYWAWTGDIKTVAECWDTLQNIWQSRTWDTGTDGLWDLPGNNMFLDWSCIREDKKGRGHAAINSLRIIAAEASAQLARALGRDAESLHHAQCASDIRQTLRMLIDPGTGGVRTSLDHEHPGIHASILALMAGVGTVSERERILHFLETQLHRNFQTGLKYGMYGRGTGERRAESYVELYFMFFVAPILAENGRPDIAEHLLAEHYGYLREQGAVTLPENFSWYASARGSRCHSWAGGGSVYAARYILGLRPAANPAPNQLIFSPLTSDAIRSASGRIAHPLGWIHVSWERRAGDIIAQIDAPEGLTILR